MRAVALPLALVVLLWGAGGSAQGRSGRDPWHGFGGLELGESIDALLAHNGDCWPPVSSRQAGQTFNAVQIAEFAFGFALPHPHTDTLAVQGALEEATLCSVTLLGDHARALVLAMGRVAVAITVWFNPSDRPDTVSSDSIRASLRRAWGARSVSRTLDSWYGARARAFYLLPVLRPGMGREWGVPRLMLVDLAACSAFDRRVHRRPGSGVAQPC